MKIINISGESREFEEKGFIYEFPFPSKNPTEVPDTVGKKLLETKQFAEFIVEEKKIKKEVKKNGI
jgi:hypothetical protein